MKKLLLLLLTLTLAFSLTACGSEGSGTSGEEEKEDVAYEVSYENASIYVDSIDTIWATAIWEVTNTGGKPLNMDLASCDFEDADGALVATESLVSVYPDIINPGEKAYYYVETILDTLPEGEEIKVIPRVEAEMANSEKVRYETSEVELIDQEYWGIEALGRVENITSEPVESLEVAVILFDEEDKPAQVLHAWIAETIEAGQKIGFEATTLYSNENFTTENVSRFETYAYPDNW